MKYILIGLALCATSAAIGFGFSHGQTMLPAQQAKPLSPAMACAPTGAPSYLTRGAGSISKLNADGDEYLWWIVIDGTDSILRAPESVIAKGRGVSFKIQPRGAFSTIVTYKSQDLMYKFGQTLTKEYHGPLYTYEE